MTKKSDQEDNKIIVVPQGSHVSRGLGGMEPPGTGLGQTVEQIMRDHADRPALKQRAVKTVVDQATGRHSVEVSDGFDVISYQDLWSRTAELATGLSAQSVNVGDFVVSIGFTSIEYATLNLAIIYLGTVQVPLQHSMPPSQIRAILDETAPRVIATSPAHLNETVDFALATASRPMVLIFDHHPEDDEEKEILTACQRRLAEAGLEMHTIQELLERGRELSRVPVFAPDNGDDPLRLLIYTSGSTGTPKGAMYRDRFMRSLWVTKTLHNDIPSIEEEPPVVVNFTPMSHAFAHAVLANTLTRGGIAYFTAKSDLSMLLEDISLVRPTELLAVPRILDMLYDEYQREMSRDKHTTDAALLDAVVKSRLREQFLGGRVRRASVGGAPISVEMKSFADSCLGFPLDVGYGSTETGIIIVNGAIQRPPVIEYKLVDVPELGYYNSDRPNARGELMVKLETMFSGYYKQPDATSSVFDEEGFYRTGDVMEETEPGNLIYLNRRNNVQKLSQGEFVTISRVESILASSPLISQIFVHGESERAYLLAVIVPSQAARSQTGSLIALKSLLADELRKAGKRYGLESYEIPRDFLIETEPFSAANGLLSGIGKPIRPQLLKKFGKQLETLYSELEINQRDRVKELRQGASEESVYELFIRATEALFGVSRTILRSDMHFTEFGAESLQVLTFSNLLHDIFNVEVPVGTLLSPSSTLQSLTQYVESRQTANANQPTFTSVHGRVTEIRASDLQLDKFIEPATLEGVKDLPAPDSRTPETVLLTGATGYLGRFICLYWLDRLAACGGKLICVVRGPDAEAARVRLDSVFDSGDAELKRRYGSLAREHLEVLAGDLSETCFGLDEPMWERLTEEVDLIVHPGALVNHALPYEQLFGPNVVGTAELIRLAVTRKVKPFVYVSTVAVADQITEGPLDEISDVRKISSLRQLNDNYANGYTNSKWAGEVLLREANDLCGLPVTVFRSDMVLAHSDYAGQLNVLDVFTRLLYSIVVTGIAPKSFYALDSEGNVQTAHYDGLPVEFSAQAVGAIGALTTTGYRTYNLVNPHSDGVSLDTYVGWLVENGCTVTPIEKYSEWFERFSIAIRSLPIHQRRNSVYPFLHVYEEPEHPAHGGSVPSLRFQEAVREKKVSGYNEIPKVTSDLINKYLSDLRRLRLL